MIARKFKIIPGHLKMDIQPPYEGIPCCLTPNLFEVTTHLCLSVCLLIHLFAVQVEPFPDSRNRRPIREIEEFPSREVYTPYTTFKYVDNPPTITSTPSPSPQEFLVCVSSKLGLPQCQSSQYRCQGTVPEGRGPQQSRGLPTLHIWSFQWPWVLTRVVVPRELS